MTRLLCLLFLSHLLWYLIATSDTNVTKADEDVTVEETNQSDAVLPEKGIAPEEEPEQAPAGRTPFVESVRTAEDFLNAGNPARLVILTAKWCDPCTQYKKQMTDFNASKRFDADIQFVDIDDYPHLYRILKHPKNSIPQTIYADQNGRIHREVGAKSKRWLSDRIHQTACTSAIMSYSESTPSSAVACPTCPTSPTASSTYRPITGMLSRSKARRGRRR